MCSAVKTETHHEEAVDAMPCQIRWHLCFVFGLIGAGMLLLGSGWLYNANLGRTNEKRIEVMENQLLERTKALDEIKGDIKELLRRNTRVSSVTPDKDG